MLKKSISKSIFQNTIFGRFLSNNIILKAKILRKINELKAFRSVGVYKSVLPLFKSFNNPTI